MPPLLKQMDDQRFRESPGLSYEEFNAGDIYEHRPGRTITETDSIWHSLLCMNQHPLHVNRDYAESTEFGKIVVSSSLTLGIIAGMTVNLLSAKAIANLGWEEIKLQSPVFVGDTLYAESEILAKRLSKSDPSRGVVTAKSRGIKDDGTQCLVFTRSFLIKV